MTLALPARRFARRPPGLGLAFRLALREQRNGVRGFYVFIACIALGVAAITGVGALADALASSFEQQGQVLLGGDVVLARPHQRLTGRERDWLFDQGRVSEVAALRAMARTLDRAEQALVEVKGVDASYPLIGGVKLAGGVSLSEAVRKDVGAAIDPVLLERLGLKLGDRISLGRLEVFIRGVIEAEPDKISDRLTVGPRVFVSLETLERTGLIDPGSLVTWRYAIELPKQADAASLAAFRTRVKAVLPEGGFTVRDRRDPSPQVTRTLERLRQFLTLVGLTSLLVGGVGVANAVATFIDRRRRVIATLKSLGATSSILFGIHLVQVLAIAGIGVVAGIGLGLLLPVVLTGWFGEALPIKVEPTLGMRSLATAAAYGILVTLLFTLWPLGRAEGVRAGVLFRDEVERGHQRPRWSIVLVTGAVAVLLCLFAIFSSEARRLALYYCLGVAGVFLLYYAVGAGISWLARRLPRPRRPELALAIGNLGAPGGLTRSVVLSLGAGLSLLVTVALVDRSIVDELTTRLPNDSPNYFVLDIKRDDFEAFQALVGREAPGARLAQAPMLRGRLVKLGLRSVEQVRAAPEAQWVLSGDRGLTYAATVPEGSVVVAGSWWPPDYDGEPLVSFDAELAKGLGVGIGDTVSVNVLGRNVTARIANLRDVRWESLALNFVMVFSPNTLAGAPHHLLATITLPKEASLANEAALLRAIGRAFPATTAIRVKDALETFNAIFTKVMIAVDAAGGVTLAAGALVLAGALATARRRRIKQAVILKTLGATRRQVLLAHLAEYVLLALLTSFIALVVGSVAAWAIVARAMDFAFVFSAAAALQTILVASVLVALFGGVGTWRVLQAPSLPTLRSE